MGIEYSMFIDAQVLKDNDIFTAYPKGVGVPLHNMEAGRLLEAMNFRINELETQVRLLQQPSGNVSWAKR